MSITQEHDLIDRILDVTKSPHSTLFYKKAVKQLGCGIVEEELGEVRMQMQTGYVKDPAKYFTKLLQNQLSHIQPLSNPDEKSSEPVVFSKTYFSPTQLDLFTELTPVTFDPEKAEDSLAVDLPYSKDSIPWVTLLEPGFFTFSSNKAKSDKVSVVLRSLDGASFRVPLVRGRIKPGGDERGILKVEHAKVLGAIENIWVQQGCQFLRYPNGAISAYCHVSIRNLAGLLGRHNIGGKDRIELADMVYDLSVFPYYLDYSAVPEYKSLGLKGIGFKILKSASLVDKHAINAETNMTVYFDKGYSQQLYNRRVVSRPLDMLSIRGELSYLVRLYLEPILVSRGSSEHSVGLCRLIELLNLPPADWHKRRNQRKRHFTKVINELNQRKVYDGRVFHCQLQPSLSKDDHILVSRLVDLS